MRALFNSQLSNLILIYAGPRGTNGQASRSHRPVVGRRGLQADRYLHETLAGGEASLCRGCRGVEKVVR